ncbi:oligosaccharide flippase family protein [Latilactobacillus sakei]|uniref:oligosaccharide flippase family protein n=1 Tax=Latilactobacillus sakei TaxID=1599 RepID=UPI0009757168|nr:oligosaccharide flippase family protein [Latilactobacillus sakei]
MTSLKKNFIYNAMYQVLIVLLPIITAPYISRVLGASKMGIYSYTYSIAYYFLLAAKLGLDNYGNRSISRVRDDKDKINQVFSSIYYFQFFIACIAIIGYIGYLFFISNNLTIAVIQILWVIGAIFDVNWLFYGLENFKVVVFRNTVVKVLAAIMILLLVRKSSDLWIYTLIMGGSALIGFLVTWPFVLKQVRLVYVKKQDVFKHFKQILILFIPVIAISVFTVLDKIMLGKLSSFSQVGFFEGAEKILIAPKGVIGALGIVMLPRMASLYGENNLKQKNKYIELSLSFAIVLSIAFMFGLIAISSNFVPFFYGIKFKPTITLLSIMAITLPFYSIGNVIRTQMLIPSMRDAPYVVSVILGAIINVIINLMLIKPLGAVGAVVATLCAEIIVACYQINSVKKELELRKYMKLILYFFVIGLFMASVVLYIGVSIKNRILGLTIQIVVGMSIYSLLGIYTLKKSKDPVITLLSNRLKIN